MAPTQQSKLKLSVSRPTTSPTVFKSPGIKFKVIGLKTSAYSAATSPAAPEQTIVQVSVTPAPATIVPSPPRVARYDLRVRTPPTAKTTAFASAPLKPADIHEPITQSPPKNRIILNHTPPLPAKIKINLSPSPPPLSASPKAVVPASQHLAFKGAQRLWEEKSRPDSKQTTKSKGRGKSTKNDSSTTSPGHMTAADFEAASALMLLKYQDPVQDNAVVGSKR